MDTKIIYDENGNGFVRAFIDDEVESVNPVEYYKSYELKKRTVILRDLLSAEAPQLASKLDNSFFEREAKETLNGFFEEIEAIELHENYAKLLDTNKKKEQVSLLKGMSLTPEQLIKLIFKSYNDYGYLYSKYNIETLPPNIDDEELPKVAHLKEDGTIYKVGETNLKDGELKNMLENRKVIVSHFFEKDNNWHCFFTTYNSLGGKENWKGGQAHFHYISSAFGISKHDFIESMKTGKYKSTNVHIDLFEYGNQVKEVHE